MCLRRLQTIMHANLMTAADEAAPERMHHIGIVPSEGIEHTLIPCSHGAECRGLQETSLDGVAEVDMVHVFACLADILPPLHVSHKHLGK